MLNLSQRGGLVSVGYRFTEHYMNALTGPVKALGDNLGSRVELKGLKILVVDDDQDARDLLSIIFEQSGAEVILASSAKEALSVVNDSATQFKFDLLVSDIGMPELDGYGLIREIRLQEALSGTYLPAIAVTAWTQNEDRLRALSSGFQIHLHKPIDFTELLLVAGSLTGRFAQSDPSPISELPM